jgi:hypothetical protein
MSGSTFTSGMSSKYSLASRYLDGPYYITPNDQVGQDAFRQYDARERDHALVAHGLANHRKCAHPPPPRPGEADIIGRPDRPSSIVAPIRNH